MERLPLGSVIDDLLAARIVLRPPWYQRSPPFEVLVVRDERGVLLVVWDTVRSRIERAVAYDEARLRAELPRLMGSLSVWPRDVAPADQTHRELALSARAFLDRLARTLERLRLDSTLGLAWTRAPQLTQYVRFTSAIGWLDVTVSCGAVVRVGAIAADTVEPVVGEILFASDEHEPRPMDAALLALLGEGEARFVALRERMARGEIGWRVHVDKVVVDVDGNFFDAAFHGVTVTYSHAFRPGHVLAEMLTRALTEAEPSAIVPLLPGQQASLRASVKPR